MFFVSWSGDRGKAEAEALKALLESVLPVTAFVSSKDLHVGEFWWDRLRQKMSEAKYTVVVLTAENLHEPWIHFESGMASTLRKQEGKIGVFRGIGLDHLDVGSYVERVANLPFFGFNAATPSQDGLNDLINSIRERLDPLHNTISVGGNNVVDYLKDRQEKLSKASETLGDQKLPPFLQSVYRISHVERTRRHVAAEVDAILSRLLRWYAGELVQEVRLLGEGCRWHAIPRISNRLWRPFELSGQYQQAIEFACMCQGAAATIGDRTAEYWIRIRNIAWLHVLNGDYEAARDELESLEAARGELTPEQLFYLSRYSGVVYMCEYDDDEVAHHLDRASTCFSNAEQQINMIPDEDRRLDLRARIVQNMGNLALKRGRVAEAVDHYQSALDSFSAMKAKDLQHIAIASDRLANAIVKLHTQGVRVKRPRSLEEAERLASDAQYKAIAAGWNEGLARAHFTMGEVFAARQEYPRAASEFKLAMELYRSLDGRRSKGFEAARLRFKEMQLMEPPAKPLGQTLGWSVRGSANVFQCPWFKLRQDSFSVQDRGQGTYTYLEHPGSVFVVPRTPDGLIVLIRSYRFTIDAWCWEVPAGSLADCGDRTPEAMARAELEEEIGGTCRELELLGEFYLGNGFASHRAYFFLARDVELTRAARRGPFEEIAEIASFSPEEIEGMIRHGMINDGDSAFALLLALKMGGGTHAG